MTHVIDRRLNGKHKSIVNRQRFIRRYKHQIKKAVADAVSGRSIRDIESGERVTIPAREISEPVFSHGPGGRRESIHPGNTDFVAGDRVKRPSAGDGKGGREASNSGEGQDDFVFQISREEFLQFFFEGLELPNMVKTQLARDPEYKHVRAGFTTSGAPSNLNVIRSLKCAQARRIALRAPYIARLREIERKLKDLMEEADESDEYVITLRGEINRLRTKIRSIPFIDTFDLRYNNRVKQPKPTTQAVMFCIMDVSGSMDQLRKDMAKRFFTLLYLFLTRTYEHTEVVFIRHHTIAKEVDEQEFFYSRETGGTVVSSALDLMLNIIRDRFPTSRWNIYAAQASDGDNWPDDSPRCRELLTEQIMVYTQYYAYIEIAPKQHQSLWLQYQRVKEIYRNFAMQEIDGPGDIYPVFRELFKRQAQ
jgi:Uncharacterized conserved protein